MITDLEIDIIEKLRNDIGYEGPKISQKQFDDLVDYVMNIKDESYNKKEIIWRLCGCYEGLNFNKVIDIFIDSRDSFYVSELVSYVDGNLDQDYLVDKMIKTNDLNFIKDSMSICFDAMLNSLKEIQVQKLKDFCNSKKI